MEMMSPSIKEIAKALSIAQAKINNVKKEKSGHNHKYAELSECLDMIRKPLAEVELSLIQFPSENSRGEPIFITMLMHSSGEWIRGFYALKGQKTGACNEMQSLGSAITYLRRYCLCAMLGLAQEDDDGASATSKSTAAPKANDQEDWGGKLVTLCRAYGIDAKDFAKRFKITTQQIESVKAAVQNFQSYLDLYNNPDENNQPLKEDTLP